MLSTGKEGGREGGMEGGERERERERENERGRKNERVGGAGEGFTLPLMLLTPPATATRLGSRASRRSSSLDWQGNSHGTIAQEGD